MTFLRGFAVGLIATTLLVTTASRAMSSSQAIRKVFGPYSSQALRVSWCESRWRTWARNGSHTGLFQLGSWERKHFAHGRYSSALEQSLAAWRYFVATGRDWGAWSCRP